MFDVNTAEVRTDRSRNRWTTNHLVTCACARKHLQLIWINGAPFTRLTQEPHDKSNNVIAKDECRRGLSNAAPPGVQRAMAMDWTERPRR